MKIFFNLILLIILAMVSCTQLVNNQNLTDVLLVDDTFIIDLKYATNDNFLHKKVYQDTRASLIHEVAEALSKAQTEFKQHGVGIKIWDAYRPMSVQEFMWQLVPDERYVSNPKSGGRHTRGTAIDLTLVDLKTGRELIMPTAFDNFTEKAHRGYVYTNHEIKANMKLLDSIMQKYGFTGMSTEWWHYDYNGWQNFPVINSSKIKI